ncbi:2-hydroxyacid dehydrogenase [Maribacter polysiphoniae]|uniref:2-hydroxyacid dehydrogenase n=1 Tax=Maribacter polysiphoniae TaxID=429344 RepID=A0A316E2D0_9FLAO|nr:2-hydroxyacid dehydrogenase [Maribacter polysiphoniae]MBD1261057.1 2-hydroxyacid dehydrogenase [Maribacter polysiphoniae]PWK23702.1 D-lactate dehydrogenase [Maribacter polysiphoniae]
MKLLVYSAQDFEIPFLEKANRLRHKVTFIPEALDTNTALKAVGHDAVSIFSGDDACLIVLEKLRDLGVKYITLRSAGYNNIQIKGAKRFGFKVANAPDYSPHAIAEHAVALLMTVNRKTHIADRQVHRYNFEQQKLLGFDLVGKTIGIVGTGRIGSVMVKIMHGFGCRILAHDLIENQDLVDKYGVAYVDLAQLYAQADIISLHLPLTSVSHHMLNGQAFEQMKPGVVLLNTARGAIVETKALIKAIGTKKIGFYAADVYEKEKGLFFKNNAPHDIKDENLKTLLSFPNVLLTPHQAYVTKEALTRIAEITFDNLDYWEQGKPCPNELGYETLVL